MNLATGCHRLLLFGQCVSVILLLIVCPTQTASAQVREEQREIERIIVDKRVLLLPRTVEVAPGITHVRSSEDRLFISGFTVLPVLVVGEVTVEQVKHDILIPSLTLRYGLLRDLQVELLVPWRYRLDRIAQATGTVQPGVLAPEVKTREDAFGIGDIEVAGLYRLMNESGPLPHILFGLRFKTRTGSDPLKESLPSGTGFYGLRGNLMLIKTIDPLVLFGSIRYTYNIPRHDALLTQPGLSPLLVDIDPGDTLDWTLGAAYVLSTRIAFNFSFDERVAFKEKINGRDLARSSVTVAQLQFGIIFVIRQGLTASLAYNHGLDRDAPDYVIKLSLPYTF